MVEFMLLLMLVVVLDVVRISRLRAVFFFGQRQRCAEPTMRRAVCSIPSEYRFHGERIVGG